MRIMCYEKKNEISKQNRSLSSYYKQKAIATAVREEKETNNCRGRKKMQTVEKNARIFKNIHLRLCETMNENVNKGGESDTQRR